MNDTRVIGAVEIRELYALAIRESGHSEMNYLAFYEWLRARGLKPKGSWPKEHHRSIYNAVTKRSDWVKVAPGVFRPVSSSDATGDSDVKFRRIINCGQ